MVDLHKIESQLRCLLEEVESPGSPKAAVVREYLAEQLRLALASLERNAASADPVERRDRW